MKIESTNLSGVLIFTPEVFSDNRGDFSEIWSRASFARHGIDLNFVQENRSVSHRAGTLRGLHFQSPPLAQDKLIRCTFGRIFDVAVDIRKGSPSYGNWTSVELCRDTHKLLLVPKGFLHGFVTLEPDSEVIYLCSNPYSVESEGIVRWNSASLGIDWGLRGDPVLSEKDAAAQDMDEFVSPFVYEAPA